MKNYVIFLIVVVMSICAMAQDIIITNDAKKIDAKILEVSTTEIRYKELDNLDGPIFILRADEINSIIYANGKVVLYNKRNDELDTSEHEKKEAEAVAKANNFGELFGRTENTNISKGEGKKGSPIGIGSHGVGSWSLDGRGIKGTMPMPTKDFKQEGKVVVQIRVNAAGNVVEATVIGGDVSDNKTQQLAIDAARKAKFTEGDSEQTGTITYVFKLN